MSACHSWAASCQLLPGSQGEYWQAPGWLWRGLGWEKLRRVLTPGTAQRIKVPRHPADVRQPELNTIMRWYFALSPGWLMQTPASISFSQTWAVSSPWPEISSLSGLSGWCQWLELRAQSRQKLESDFQAEWGVSYGQVRTISQSVAPVWHDDQSEGWTEAPSVAWWLCQTSHHNINIPRHVVNIWES